MFRMDEYTKKIIEYINNTQFEKKIEEPSLEIFLKDSTCGDSVKIAVRIEQDVIVDIGYSLYGCSLQIASFEILCSFLLGKNSKDISCDNFKNIILEELRPPSDKEHCIDFSINAVTKLLNRL
jgi:nitrogen fixation NifU-like protein